MKKIDSFILKKFQKFADFLQITFGLSSFTISRMILITWFLIFTMRDMIQSDDNGIKIVPPFLVFPALLVVFSIWSSIKQAEYDHIHSPEFKNRLEEKYFIMRCICIVVLLICSVRFISLLKDVHTMKGFGMYFVGKITVWELLSYSLLFYFVSCTPKPPQKSKFKKLVERLTTTTPEIKTQTV